MSATRRGAPFDASCKAGTPSWQGRACRRGEARCSPERAAGSQYLFARHGCPGRRRARVLGAVSRDGGALVRAWAQGSINSSTLVFSQVDCACMTSALDGSNSSSNSSGLFVAADAAAPMVRRKLGLPTGAVPTNRCGDLARYRESQKWKRKKEFFLDHSCPVQQNPTLPPSEF